MAEAIEYWATYVLILYFLCLPSILIYTYNGNVCLGINRPEFSLFDT